MADYKKKLYKKIAEVVSLVCTNPSIFVSETDIHALMMKALMEIPCLNPFDKDEIKYINDPINLKDKKKYLIPKYIFEFGTDKSGGYKKHLYGDFIKLFECQDEGNGFLIHIHRS